MKFLLTGATGAAGLEILRALLNDTNVSQVTVLSRRPLPPQIPSSPKANVIIHEDFLSYPPSLIKQISDHDGCIWALGKASAGMSEAEYSKLTYDFPMEAAKAVRESGYWSAERPFRFVYMSGEGVDASGKSWFMFSRVKGKAERDLLGLASSSSGAFISQMLRPAYFAPTDPQDQEQTRGGESVLKRTATEMLAAIVPSLQIPIKDLAKATVEIAKGLCGNNTLYRNVDLRKLGKERRKDEL